jgi:hypothetical protein
MRFVSSGGGRGCICGRARTMLWATNETRIMIIHAWEEILGNESSPADCIDYFFDGCRARLADNRSRRVLSGGNAPTA